jgi:hypothetical protein
MANTLIPIQTYTLSSSSASITFDNIPQNYTDLVLKFSARSTQTGGYSDDLNLNFNGTASVLSDKLVYGTGAAATSTGYSAQTNIWVTSVPNSSTTTSTFGNAELYIPNYNSTTTYKSFSLDGVTENNATNALGSLTAGLYSYNSAITSIKLQLGSGSFVQYSTFTLYGISNGVKATGGTLTVAGGYAYHTFTSTGSFLPNQQIKGAEILMVAGGGGGGRTGGGAGAGGLLYSYAQTLNAGNSYTALIGAGGAGSNTDAVAGTQGGSSVFASLSTTGGGGGGSYGGAGGSGGSGGGGGAIDGGSAQAGGTGVFGQGNNGGVGAVASGSNRAAGGGGGAGAVGTAAVSGTSGTGGVGTSTYTTWHSITGTGVLYGGVYYIAGGGGGTGSSGTAAAGGAGGGGAGTATTGTNGTSNTGGGAGGGIGGSGSGGGTGGSGLIIVRYPLS